MAPIALRTGSEWREVIVAKSNSARGFVAGESVMVSSRLISRIEPSGTETAFSKEPARPAMLTSSIMPM